MTEQVEKVHKTVYVVFVSLLLDLLAFTLILPLLPSLLDHYKANDNIGLYAFLSDKIVFFQKLVGAPDQFNSVLFGGFLGSMFSFLQFIVAPIVGGLSDVLGRKTIMIVCLMGIAFSYILWALSHNFALFILARFIGGLSKGNVSLSTAIITDVSSIKTRGKGMAFVGIAFSLGFIIGPLIGAAFAVWAKTKTGDWFVVPALFAVCLAVGDLIFFSICFEETLPKEKRAKDLWKSLDNAKSLINIKQLFRFKTVTDVKEQDIKKLRTLGIVYFVYLFIYSGLEFTLTFLTHHVFHYTSMQQGWMFFVIGITMALMQGGYTRKIKPENNKKTAVNGLWLIIPSFVCVGIADNIYMLYLGLLLFAISTAMVVPCMLVMASEFGSAQQKGTVMGIFRSLGSLARAIGPIFASIAFWSIGSKITYITGAILLLWPVIKLKNSL